MQTTRVSGATAGAAEDGQPGGATQPGASARAAAGTDRPGARRRTGRGRLRPSNLTTRAIALAVVILMLTISYANSLRIYFAQAHEVASTKAEIADREARIADLQTELGRWNDPAFVRLQARSRLGWVMPGEIGFAVVAADGSPLGGGAEIAAGAKPAGEGVPEAWYAKLWGSVEAADHPPAPEPDPADIPPITKDNVDDGAGGSTAPR